MKSQITNHKHQINSNIEFSNVRKCLDHLILEFGYYLGFGVWCLGFTILLLSISSPITAQTEWYKYPGNPVLRLGESDEWGFNIYAKDIIYENDLYRMWYNEWTFSTSFEELHYATSVDGIHWEVYDGTPVTFEHEGDSWGKGLFYFDIIKIDSVYNMWYNTIDEDDDLVIGLAWSMDGFRWKRHPEPVLRGGNEGDWDAGHLGAPQVIFYGHRYYMWYTSTDNNRPVRQMTGLATSDDGIHWKKHPANPVFGPGKSGSWDDHEVVTFCVNYNGSYYELWYNGSDLSQFNIGYASSSDGIHWNRSSASPVLKAGELGSWEGSYPFGATVIRQDTVYRMWYQGTNKSINGFGYATTSIDETIAWDKTGIDKPKRIIGVRVFNRSEMINIGSLEDVMPHLSGTELIDAFNNLALAYSLNDDKKSFLFADKALELAEKEDYPEGKAMALYSMSNCQYVMGNYSDALANQLSALRLFDSLGNLAEKGNMLSQIASIQAYTGSYDLACRYHKQALDLFEELNDTVFILQSLNYLGYAYLQNSDTPNAIKTFNRSLDLAKESSNIWRQPVNHDALGTCYSGRKLDSALLYFNEAGLIWDELPSEFQKHLSLGKHYLLIAEAYYAAGPEHYKKAAEYFLKYYEFQFLGSNPLIVRLLFGMAELYLNTGRLEKARESLDGSLYLCSKYLSKLNHQLYSNLNNKLEDEIYLKSYMEKIYRLYYRLDTTNQNKDLAFAHYKLAMQWKDSIYNLQNRRQWAMMQGQYETESAQSQIAVLESENEVKDLRIKQSRTFLFGMGGFVVVIVFMGLLFIRQNKIRAEHKTVILEQKLLRLQMNPHFIFNALSNILNFINRKDTDNAANYLTTFSRLLRTTLESSREDYILLDEEIGSLKNYLDLQLLRYDDKFDYSIDVDEDIDIENAIIPPMLLQPFIENAIEHGIRHKESKGKINVRFILKNKKVICEVEDDGVGREKAWEAEYQKRKTHKSLATTIINDRIQSLNKKLKQKISLSIIDLKSDTLEPTGTKVVLNIPYLLD